MTSKKDLLYMIELLRGNLLELETEVDLLRGAVDRHQDIILMMKAKKPKKSDKKVRAALEDLKKVLDETEPKRGRGRPRKNP